MGGGTIWAEVSQEKGYSVLDGMRIPVFLKKREDVMSSTVRARVNGGVLEPLEKVDLPEGKEVTITILRVPSGRDFEAFARAAGGWRGTIDAETLIRDIYADRLVSTRSAPQL